MSYPLQFAYYSHHKCATAWTNTILRELSFHMGLNHRTAHGPQDYGDQGSIRRWIEAHDVESLAFTNAEIEEVKVLPSHRGFHVVRDPRDVLVSGYFSHLHSHPTDEWPELKEHRESLQCLSKEEGLLKEMEFSRPFLEAMLRWDYNQDHILEVKMEELTSNAKVQFRRILEHSGLLSEKSSFVYKTLQKVNRLFYAIHHRVPGSFVPSRIASKIPIDARILDSVVERNTFNKMTGGRSKGEENKKSHYRKGEHGDWVNHFTNRVAESFESKYEGVVSELGYEGTFDLLSIEKQ